MMCENQTTVQGLLGHILDGPETIKMLRDWPPERLICLKEMLRIAPYPQMLYLSASPFSDVVATLISVRERDRTNNRAN